MGGCDNVMQKTYTEAKTAGHHSSAPKGNSWIRHLVELWKSLTHTLHAVFGPLQISTMHLPYSTLHHNGPSTRVIIISAPAQA